MLTIFPENRLNADKLIQILSDRRKTILLELANRLFTFVHRFGQNHFADVPRFMRGIKRTGSRGRATGRRGVEVWPKR